MLTFLKNIASGFALGTAEIIPGVSGGTIALVLGCYNELLESINHFRKQWRKSLLFLIPLLIGMAAAILLISSLVEYLLEYHSLPTMLFFVGLICGIIPILFTKVQERGRILNIKIRTVLLMLLPIAVLVALSMSSFSVIDGTDYAEIAANMEWPLMLFIFFAGILAACALVMPGVSGSFILLTLGLYPLVIHTVSSVTDMLGDITNTALLLNIVKVLLPFGVGIVIGALSMVRLMEFLLKKHRKAVYAVILGLLIGSVYAIFSGPVIFQSGTPTLAIIIGIVTFAAGAVLSYMLGRKKL